MSTRSGKRIHGSFRETVVLNDTELVTKSVKKTRSKLLKDNTEVLETTVSKSKKRNNYVSYPSDEEPRVIPEVPTNKEPVRVLRNNALKEQNLNISNQESIDVVDSKKPVRKTRRTKKFVEDEPDQNPDKEILETITHVEKKTKKNKKKKEANSEVANENEVAVASKKSKRRKKKSNQESKGETKNSMNHSAMSADSFHSAAGSPVCAAGTDVLNATFQKSPEITEEIEENLSQDILQAKNSGRKRRRSSVNTDALSNMNASVAKANTPNNKSVSRQNSTFEINDVEPVATVPSRNSDQSPKQNSTFEITEENKDKQRKSSINNATFDDNSSLAKEDGANTTYDKNKSGSPSKLNTTFESRRRSLRLSSAAVVIVEPLNGTYDKDDKQTNTLNTTFDKETNLNSTFDKDEEKSSSKSSLVTSDDTGNLTFDKSDERISITSDDSRIENTTPVLIESSMEESGLNTSESKKQSPKSVPTPLKRQSTFTKDGPEVDPKASLESNGLRTPTKRMSLATPGSTPFPFSKSGQKEKVMLNVTRSIEKSRLSMAEELAPRMTRVMFCSPVNNPVVVAQQKRKVIKSNLKGSNKSFVFEETAVSGTAAGGRAAPRKRSYTHNDAEDGRAKRTRLADDQQQSVDRLSRPRTSSSKPNEPSTPSKRIPTPSKSKSESKVSRTKLPNFAALHQRRFDKMESLDECQERKAKRAKQLLTPSANINVLERSSPRGSEQGKGKEEVKKPETKRPQTKPEGKPTRSKDAEKRPDTKGVRVTGVRPLESRPDENKDTSKSDGKGLTLDSLKRGYTRFGFKMNVGVNPFSVPSKEVKVKETKIINEKKNGLTRQASQPSLAGATLARKEAAKQLVMREKSFTERRGDTRRRERTVIRGVRTNRRFELQMQMRNVT